MTAFHETALLLTALWLGIVASRFRRSLPLLVAGLSAVALYALAALAYGAVTPADLGLAPPASWPATAGLALLWLGVMLACSPLADRLATRFVAAPPTLEAFRPIQQSRAKLVAGIGVAWLLGGLLEELVLRGVVLGSVQSLLAAWLVEPLAAAAAVGAAALAAAVLHLYQGPRAALIVAQLSLLFGVLYVALGHNLWAVMLCHGLYDTIAFVRFAGRRSAYSRTADEG